MGPSRAIAWPIRLRSRRPVDPTEAKSGKSLPQEQEKGPLPHLDDEGSSNLPGAAWAGREGPPRTRIILYPDSAALRAHGPAECFEIPYNNPVRRIPLFQCAVQFKQHPSFAFPDAAALMGDCFACGLLS
jgi:hypothetical protein